MPALNAIFAIGWFAAVVAAAYVILNHAIYLTSLTGAAIYLGGPLAAIAVVSGCFAMRERYRRYAFAILLGFVALGYVWETYLLVEEGWMSARPVGDSRSKEEFIAHLRAEGKNPVPAITANAVITRGNRQVLTIDGSEMLPLSGISNRLTVLCNEGGVWETYRSDIYGFRNPPGLWSAPEIRLAVVGDSHAHGVCVTIGKSFVGLIRRQIPQTINVGFGGNGPLVELATIVEYVSKKKPDIVPWFYFENYLQKDIYREKNHKILMRYLGELEFIQRLPDLQPRIDLALERFIADQASQARATSPQAPSGRDPVAFLRFADGINPLNHISWLTLRGLRTRLGLVKAGADWGAPEAAIFMQIMLRAKNLVDGWGGQIVFVSLPSWPTVVAGATSKKHFTDTALNVVRDLGPPIIDISSVFEEHPDPRSLWSNRRPGHFGETGHALIAETVLDRLLAANMNGGG